MSCRSHAISSNKMLTLHFIHCNRFQTFEELSCRCKLWITRFDAKKKPVAARTLETFDVEQRMIRHRQTVQREHAEHGGNRRAENGHLERDRDECRPTV